MKASARDLVRLTRELIREARKTGITTSRDLASSEMFFDDARRRAAAARRELRARFVEAKAEIERELGSSREEEHDSENVEAMWNTGGTTVRLVLAHEDKEMPFVLTLSADHRAPLLVDVAAPELCECSTLTTTKDPFVRADLVLVMNNPAIKKTHIRLAETKVESTIVRLYQCRGCKRFRQSGDAGRQYVFEVPPIDVEEWKRDPYVDYHRWTMYEAMLALYLEHTDRTKTNGPCREPGCPAKAMGSSLFCPDHYRMTRPVPPPGRALT